MPQTTLKSTGATNAAQLPVYGSLATARSISWLIALLISGVCISGLVHPAMIYPTTELLRSSLPTDLVNLLGLPCLLVSMLLAGRGYLVWLLLWPGSLLYLLYHDLVYLFSLSFNLMFVAHLVLATLSLYGAIILVAGIAARDLRQLLVGAVSEKVGGAVLTFMGSMVFLTALGATVNQLIQRSVPTASDLALHVTDCLMSPLWIIGGVLLWQRRPLGYVSGLGLLFQASSLFIGLIVLFALRPFISGVPFRITDVLVVAAMGLIVFVPFSLFLRGIMRHKEPDITR